MPLPTAASSSASKGLGTTIRPRGTLATRSSAPTVRSAGDSSITTTQSCGSPHRESRTTLAKRVLQNAFTAFSFSGLLTNFAVKPFIRAAAVAAPPAAPAVAHADAPMHTSALPLTVHSPLFPGTASLTARTRAPNSSSRRGVRFALCVFSSYAQYSSSSSAPPRSERSTRANTNSPTSPSSSYSSHRRTHTSPWPFIWFVSLLHIKCFLNLQSRRLPHGYCKATAKLVQSYCKASAKLLQS